MAVQEKLYTAEELWNLSADETKHYELIEGELVAMSPTGGHHGEVNAQFSWLIMTHVRTKKLGHIYAAETGFKLSENPDTVLAPDFAFISKKRLKSGTDKFVPVAPDLVVEV